MKHCLALAAYISGWAVMMYCVWDFPDHYFMMVVAATLAISEGSRFIGGLK